MGIGFSSIGSRAIGASAKRAPVAGQPPVVDPPVVTVTGVTITPTNTTLVGGIMQQFAWLVSGTNNPPQTVDLIAEMGSITPQGIHTPPPATAVKQVYKVTARSTVDPTQSAFALVTVPALIDPPGDVGPIVVAAPRILRTVAGNSLVREGEFGTGDTYRMLQGRWIIGKDANDILYYARDVEPDLLASATEVASVVAIVSGVTLEGDAFFSGGVLIAKIGGGDDSGEVTNSLTFRVTCTNGEVFDRTIYFSIVAR